MLQTMCGIIRGLESFEINIVKEFQTIKGPPKVDNPITCEVDNPITCGYYFLVDAI
jgi:hypothetical protein